MSEKYGVMEKGCWILREGAGKAPELQENTRNQGRGKVAGYFRGAVGAADWVGGEVEDGKRSGKVLLPVRDYRK